MRRSARAERLRDILDVLLSDVRSGLGAYLGVHLLSEHHWDEGSIGLALSLGGLAGLVSATPMGMLSATLAGEVVVHGGYSAAFLLLAGIAGLGGFLFWLFMPETRPSDPDTPASLAAETGGSPSADGPPPATVVPGKRP